LVTRVTPQSSTESSRSITASGRKSMSRDRVFQILLTVLCLLCVILLRRYVSPLQGTEFSGGRMTGPLLDLADLSVLLFLVALMLNVFRTRLSPAVTLAASLLGLPLFLYFACPGPFRRMFKGEYSVPASGTFVWNVPCIVGTIALTTALVLSLRNLIAYQARSKS
jgi:hypothetical protein